MAKKNGYKKVANGDVLIMPVDATDAQILARGKQEWTARHVRPDGTLNHNNYAPVYIRLGTADGVRVMVIRQGRELVCYRETERTDLTIRTVVS